MIFHASYSKSILYINYHLILLYFLQLTSSLSFSFQLPLILFNFNIDLEFYLHLINIICELQFIKNNNSFTFLLFFFFLLSVNIIKGNH
jgi:hypothetical protein